MAQRIVEGEQYEAYLLKGTVGNEGLPVVTGLSIPDHDFIALAYSGETLTGVTYKTGGSGGTTVGALTLTYDVNNNLTSVTRS